MIKEYAHLSAVEIVRRIKTHEIKAADLAAFALHSAETEGRRLNAVTAVCRERASSQAVKIDSLIESGRAIPALAGVPIVVKDNIALSGYPTTCGSRMLENYISPYDATCIRKLEEAGAVIVAKANMDEFAMGSSSENSAFGPVKNPVGDDLVPGGSSGGSCAAVAAGIVPIALGSDTGGSVRQPAGFCGVVGLKPTYGSVSRYGLIAFASSTDQVGPIARNTADCALALEAISGHDSRDASSADVKHKRYSSIAESESNRKFRIGIPREFMSDGIDGEVLTCVESAIKLLEANGHSIIEISLPHSQYAVAAYYIIANAEASSNLARYDGVRYGLSRGRDDTLETMYGGSRSEGFGPEVKRRIMLGTYALSAGYYDAYYDRAQKVRTLICRDFENAFSDVDLILSPTSPTAAFKVGEKSNDPLAMYLSDTLTIPASLAGLPAISIPCGKTNDGCPVGLQITADAFNEMNLLSAAMRAEKLMGGYNAEN